MFVKPKLYLILSFVVPESLRIVLTEENWIIDLFPPNSIATNVQQNIGAKNEIDVTKENFVFVRELFHCCLETEAARKRGFV